MSRALDDLHPNFRRQAVEFLAQLLEEGVCVMLVSTGRTQAEQDLAYVRGATKIRHSKHQDGLAMDVCPYSVWQLHGPDKLQWHAHDPAWKIIGQIAERNGLRWGGRFGESSLGAGDGWDQGHVELPTWSGK